MYHLTSNAVRAVAGGCLLCLALAAPLRGDEDPFDDDVAPAVKPSVVSTLCKVFDDKNEDFQSAAAQKLELIYERETGQRNTVSYELAFHHMRKEQWASALRCWREFTPPPTCVELWPSIQFNNIATCQLRLGKLNDACRTILESGNVAGNRIPDLVKAFHSQNALPALDRYLNGLLTSETVAETNDLRQEVIKRTKSARECIELYRMAEAEDIAGLWEKMEVTWWHVGPPFDFDSAAQAKELLISSGMKAKSFLLTKLRQPVAAIDPIWGTGQFAELLFQVADAREERRTAIVLLGMLKAAEILPVIRHEFKRDLVECYAADYFRAALRLGTDEGIAFVNDYASQAEYHEYHETAKKVVDQFSENKSTAHLEE